MSNLVRWNPVRDLVSMSEAMDRLFDDAFVFPHDGGLHRGQPSLDLVENDSNFVVKAELPGFNPDNVDIRVEGNVLTLRLSLPRASYPTNERAMEFFQAAEREIEKLPGVISAGFTIDLPLDGWNFGDTFEILGKPVPSAVGKISNGSSA